MLDSGQLGSIGRYFRLKQRILLLAKFWTYLLHFHREVNIKNIPIFLPDVIPVYGSHIFIRGKQFLIFPCFTLFHSREKKSSLCRVCHPPLRKNEPSLYRVYYKVNHLNRMNTYANTLYCNLLSNKLMSEFFRTRFQIFKITLWMPKIGSAFAFWGIFKQPLRNCPVKPSIFPSFKSIFLVTTF